MHNFHQALRECQNNELTVEFNCRFTSPILTTCLQEIEKHAIENFTKDIFKEVKSEIEYAKAINMIEHSEFGDNFVFKMNRFGWLKSEYEVLYDKSNSKFLCQCWLFESQGIPCCYILCVMKHEHINNIPSNTIR